MKWTLGIALAFLSFALIAEGFAPQKGPIPAKPKPEGLPVLQITCNPDSFQLIYDRPKEDIYISATLQVGKEQWKGVKLRLRGDTSREFPKKSLKLKIAKSKTLPFGRNTLNLNAEYLDKTYLRQYLSTRLFQASGQPCFDARHVLVHINGTFHGIYLMVENVDKEFLDKWGLSKDGDLFKATKDSASLSRYDNVPALWERKMPKSDSSWTVLQELIAKLNDTPDQEYAQMTHEIMSYENMVNSIALNMLIGNRSTYYHNYFMFRSVQTHQWKYLPWDMDRTLELDQVDDHYQRGNLADSHWGNMASNPWFERALVTPEILRDIQLRIDTLTSTIYTPEYLFPIIDSLAKVLAPHISADTLFLPRTLDMWKQEIEQVKAYIQQRPIELSNQFAHNPSSFQLFQPQAPMHIGDTLRWNAALDPNGDTLRYRFCFSTTDRFTTDQTLTYRDIQDTFFILGEGIRPGKYYWKVYAGDGTVEVRGFDNRCTFLMQDGQ
jgi:spore coat protein H